MASSNRRTTPPAVIAPILTDNKSQVETAFNQLLKQATTLNDTFISRLIKKNNTKIIGLAALVWEQIAPLFTDLESRIKPNSEAPAPILAHIAETFAGLISEGAFTRLYKESFSEDFKEGADKQDETNVNMLKEDILPIYQNIAIALQELATLYVQLRESNHLITTANTAINSSTKTLKKEVEVTQTEVKTALAALPKTVLAPLPLAVDARTQISHAFEATRTEIAVAIKEQFNKDLTSLSELIQALNVDIDAYNASLARASAYAEGAEVDQQCLEDDQEYLTRHHMQLTERLAFIGKTYQTLKSYIEDESLPQGVVINNLPEECLNNLSLITSIQTQLQTVEAKKNKLVLVKKSLEEIKAAKEAEKITIQKLSENILDGKASYDATIKALESSLSAFNEKFKQDEKAKELLSTTTVCRDALAFAAYQFSNKATAAASDGFEPRSTTEQLEKALSALDTKISRLTQKINSLTKPTNAMTEQAGNLTAAKTSLLQSMRTYESDIRARAVAVEKAIHSEELDNVELPVLNPVVNLQDIHTAAKEFAKMEKDIADISKATEAAPSVTIPKPKTSFFSHYKKEIKASTGWGYMIGFCAGAVVGIPFGPVGMVVLGGIFGAIGAAAGFIGSSVACYKYNNEPDETMPSPSEVGVTQTASTTPTIGGTTVELERSLSKSSDVIKPAHGSNKSSSKELPIAKPLPDRFLPDAVLAGPAGKAASVSMMGAFSPKGKEKVTRDRPESDIVRHRRTPAIGRRSFS